MAFRKGAFDGTVTRTPYERLMDPRGTCILQDIFGGGLGVWKAYGYRYEMKNADQPERDGFDLGDFLRSTLTGGLMGGLFGVAFFGVGKAVGALKGSLSGVNEKCLDTKIYFPVEYEGTVKVNGEVRDVSRRVYQRNDIDINYFDETTGLTNLEKMQSGKPPIGRDGNPIQLHHILQKEAGPMVEIQEITHLRYYSQLHGLIEEGASFRNDPLLNKQYNNFRYNYWKWRAKSFYENLRT